MLQSDQDQTMALARTRIDIERAIRDILLKDEGLSDWQREDIKYAGVGRLSRKLLELYPNFGFLQKSFQYVTQICNAAIHAQAVSDDQASEALALGAEILTAIKRGAERLPLKATAN